MSRIVTFYSYKGGVGRTFALSNIAVLLAKRGKRVLLMDWDLEAPGLHRYFKPYLTKESVSQPGLIHLLTNAEVTRESDWKPFVIEVQIENCAPLHIIPSGDGATDYVERVRSFSWSNFFEKYNGGEILDRWRSEWKNAYDFVLVDSRTGITDTGGVCTVFLPDILVLIFSANEQSFERGMQVALGVQDARRKLAVPRPPVAILPLPGRFDGRDEVDEANRWLDRFGQELKPFYDDWLPKQFQPRQILEVTKIPYVTRFSFGEPLAVISHSVSDPELPGYYLENVARLLSSDFAEAQQILSGGSSAQEDSIANFRKQLARVPIDEAALNRALEMIEAGVGSGVQFAELLREAGVALLRQSRFDSAETCLQRALHLSEEQFGPSHPSTIASLLHLAELHHSTKRLSDAEMLYRKALHEMQSLEGDYPAFANTSNNLAALYRESGRVEEAEKWYRRSIVTLERLGRPDDPAVTNAYNNLAGLYRETGRVEEAEKMYRRGLERLEHFARPDDPAVTNAYNNLAGLYRETGRVEEAEKMYQRGLDRMEHFARPDDPAVTNAYNNLAGLYRETGRVEEAEKMYRRGVERLERFARPDAPALMDAYNNLAGLYRETGRVKEAEKWYHRGIETLERFARPDDPALMNAYNSLAGLYRDIGRIDEAETWYQRGLGLLERVARPTDPALTEAYINLASMYHESGRLEEAERLYQRTLTTLEKIGSRNSPNYAIVLRGLGDVSLARRNPREAEHLFRQSLAILENIYDRDHPDAVKTRERLASILESRGNTDEAAVLRRHVAFDTFISYNRSDRRVVHQLVRELEARRVRVWLDERELPPGARWEDTLKRVIDTVGSTIFCIGPSGFSSWQKKEFSALERRGLSGERRVLPVLLPGSAEFPAALREWQWLDLREGITKEGVDQLVWGITGRRPRN